MMSCIPIKFTNTCTANCKEIDKMYSKSCLADCLAIHYAVLPDVPEMYEAVECSGFLPRNLKVPVSVPVRTLRSSLSNEILNGGTLCRCFTPNTIKN